jgi:hypothetical protein
MMVEHSSVGNDDGRLRGALAGSEDEEDWSADGSDIQKIT